MKRECETCVKHKTPYCPTSIECMATDDMSYYKNRIMLLEENIKYKEVINEAEKILNECKLLMPHEFDEKEQIDNVIDILKEVSK